MFVVGCSATGVSEASRTYGTHVVRGAGGNDSTVTIMQTPESSKVYSLTGDAQEKPMEYKMQTRRAAGGNGGPIDIHYTLGH